MVTLVYGQPGTGKSTFAKGVYNAHGGCSKAILIDGDNCRNMWPDLGYSIEERFENQKRMALMARDFHDRGFDVIVATVCPTKDTRRIWYSMFPPDEICMYERTEIFDHEKYNKFKVDYYE